MNASDSAAKAAVPPDHLMGVFARAPLAFERGEGVRLYTAEGGEYLDCLAGIAVNALGHHHPTLVNALKEQSEKLWHVSNIFRIPGQEALAEKLCAVSFADVCFFTNSGSEAIECALKTARKYHTANGATRADRGDRFRGRLPWPHLCGGECGGQSPATSPASAPCLPGYIHLPLQRPSRR